ncbi:MAG: hypothetical protein PUC12_11885 [Clostridiales bacterium]|nr:hypothetical protein [Clostridiales bacterium]
MQQAEKKDVLVLNVAEIVYYLYFAIMAFAKGIGLYDGMWPYTVALFLGAVLIILKLMLTEHTIAEWLFVLGLLGLGILVCHNSGEKGVLIYIAMIVAMKNVPIKRLFAVGLAIWGGTFVMQAVLTITGVKSDIFVIHDKLGLGYIIRWSLGYPHPNVLQISFLILCAFILYLADWKGKKLIYATIIMLVGNLYVFFYSVSYTGLVVVVIYLFGNLYLSFRKELSKLEKMLVTLVFPSCVAFSVLGPVVLHGKPWEICNKLLNNRYIVSTLYLKTDPITLFGARPSAGIPDSFRNIDCSYMFALMHYGLVIFILLCVGYVTLIHHCMKEKKHKELSIIISLVVAAITEPFFVNPSYKNISFLFIGQFIFETFAKFTQKRPECFLNRKFILCPLGKRVITIRIEKLMQIKASYVYVLQKGKKVILTGAAVIALIAGSIFAITADMPECYYAVHTSTDMDSENIYLDIENLPKNFNGKILNYVDTKTPLYRVEGNIVTVEYVRGIVSSGVWCGIFGAVFISLVLYVYKKNEYGLRNNGKW